MVEKNTSIREMLIVLFSLIILLIPAASPNLTAQAESRDPGGISYLHAAPSIMTASASSISGTSATLNGYVNANNEDTTVSFEYSTSGDFTGETPSDTITATQSPVTGSNFTTVSANVTGLSPGTGYYFRIVATNASDTTYSSVQSFVTLSPATVTTGIASPVTTTTATLNGIVNANDNSTTVTFEYGTSTSYGTIVTADQSPVSGAIDTAVNKAVTGLTPNTTYHFRVAGNNALGSSNGEDQTFFTGTQTAPTAFTDDPTFSITANTATLNGTVNANNADTTVTFEYGTTTAYGNTVTANDSPVLGNMDTAVSKYITGLAPGFTYHYRVVATNSVGTTQGPDMTFVNTTAPAARTDAAAAIAQTSARLLGTVNPKTFDGGSSSWTTVVTFEYGLTDSYGSTVTANESPIGGEANQGVSFDLSGLSPNTTYHYRVVANNENGTGTGADMTFTTSSLPIVTTDTATPVGTSSATLNGTVNANGDSTTVTFEYGTTTSYGTTVTADQSPVGGTSDTAVSNAITGLTNGTTYHYRVVATNGSGTANGADMTFTTGVAPPAASTGAATSISTSSAVMNGTVNANGLDTSVYFEWGLSASYGLTDGASPSPVTGISNTSVSFTPTTLHPNTTYHYRVVAQNAGGTIYGADMSFTTNSAPTVTTGVASPVTTTTATLSGIVNANNESTAVTFQYGTTTAYGSTVTAFESPVTGGTDTAVSAGLTGLTPTTTYHYRVVGTNASGTSYGADMTFSTSVGPPIVTTGSASPTTTGGTVYGTVNAQNASTTVTFEYGTTTAYGQSVTADQSPVTGSGDVSVNATISGLSFNTTYHYRVVGVNVNGTVQGADMTFKTALNPSVFTGTATNVLGTSATVSGIANPNSGSWNASFQYGTTTSYGSSASGIPSTVTGNVDTPISANLTGLLPNTTYHYRAMLSSGMSYYGSDMTFTTTSGPSATTDAAGSVGSTSAILNGTINANNNSTTVTFEYGFDTSYGLTVNANQTPVTGNTNTAVNYALSSLLPNQTYHYRVIGSNSSGTVYGSDMTFTTVAIAPSVSTNMATGIGGTGATLNGTVNPNNDSTTVTIEYGTSTAYGTTVTADQSPLTGSSNTAVSKAITGLTDNTTYHYRVIGQNSTGTTNGADMTFTTGTNTPNAATSAASGVTTSTATLNGLINANGSSTTVTFEYGMSTAYGKTVTAVQSPVTGTTDTAVSTSISGLIGSTTYHYRVIAQNGAGVTNGMDMTFVTAGSAPDATTNAATTVGSTFATLNGTVNARNDSTTVTFEYGTTTSYGSTSTATQSPVTGDTDTAVSSTLAGLSDGVTYHYRVVGQNSFGTTYGTDQTFTTTIISLPAVTTSAISNITGSSASCGGNVVSEGQGTVTARGVCWSTTPSPVVAGSKTIDGGGAGTFISSITGLMPYTTYYVRAYATNSAGTTYGSQRSFTTTAEAVTVTITNPTQGAEVSGTVTIEATASSAARTVQEDQSINRVEFFIDDIIIGTVTSAPYKHDWNTADYADGVHAIKVVAYNANNEQGQDEISVTVNNTSGGSLSLNRTKLNFGAVPNGGTTADSFFYITYDQNILVNTGSGWSVSDDASWLSASPASGTGSGIFSVSVNPTGLSTGTYTGVITVKSSNPNIDSVTVDVTLTVYSQGSTGLPFGTFSTPVSGSTVRSSIPVTGWVLDDIAVSSVKIYRDAVAGDTQSRSNSMLLVGNANLVDGARPDVESTYPGYPMNYQAGWGYMMLTNGLPGDGVYTIYAVATDKEGNSVTLGSKTITVVNASAVKPFGTIDTPEQGGEASGTGFVNFGWALTPQPNTIPFDGSTIKVWIDGVRLSGNPVYNQYRKDIADAFPGYNNSNGAVGYMYIDTTAYANGVHTIAWSVQDDGGNSDGIGSRYFTILNTGNQRTYTVSGFNSGNPVIDYTANEYIAPVTVQKGFDTNGNIEELVFDENNRANVTIKEVEPVRIQLPVHTPGTQGYMVTESGIAPLPIGSTLNQTTGTFSWLPGPGFVGTYRFSFVFKTASGQFQTKSVDILIEPKFDIEMQEYSGPQSLKKRETDSTLK